jgi:hypothetical protein
MDNLQAFLNPVSADEVKEVVISKRFVDKDGKPVPFRIKTIMQEENERLTRKCRKVETIRGQRVESMDNQKYNRALIVACTVEPDFRNADLCKAYGTVDPLDLPGKMLTVGEANNLAREILDLNGFSDEAEQLEDEAKN